MKVPFHRPDIGEPEIEEVVKTLRSGWLTRGPKSKKFEAEFASAVGAKQSLALCSGTAALHLAVEALGLRSGQGVLVPAMTFAATAEIVQYLGAFPILVDCDPITTNIDLADAARRLEQARTGRLPAPYPKNIDVVGIIPVHVGGYLVDFEDLNRFAGDHRLWVVEDAAHAFPAAWRPGGSASWKRCGEGTSDVTCFSFYANKTITTGEGGMAVTAREDLFLKMKSLSLHGLSTDAEDRYSDGKGWDYRILDAGYKYNVTDIAASLGIHQLARAETMRRERERIARRYLDAFRDVPSLELPPADENRIHSWHLFPVKLRLAGLTVDRDRFVADLREKGIGFSVHWRPLHLHPLYQKSFGWKAGDLPAASALWPRLVSLPVYSGMTADEIDYVIDGVRELSERHAA